MSADCPPQPLLPSHSGHVSHVTGVMSHVTQVSFVSLVTSVMSRGRGAQEARPGAEHCPVVTCAAVAGVVAD